MYIRIVTQINSYHASLWALALAHRPSVRSYYVTWKHELFTAYITKQRHAYTVSAYYIQLKLMYIHTKREPRCVWSMFWLIVRSYSVTRVKCILVCVVHVGVSIVYINIYVINWCHMYWPEWIKIIHNLTKNLSLKPYEIHHIHIYIQTHIWSFETQKSRRSSYSFKLGCVNILYICINKHWIWAPRVTIVFISLYEYSVFPLSNTHQTFWALRMIEIIRVFLFFFWYSVNETGDYNNKNNERTDSAYYR